MLAALLVLALQAPPPDQDRVHLKDGSVRSGRVLSEGADGVLLETLILGPKGQVVGRAQVTLAKSAVERIERASEASRKAAEDRARAFGERGIRRTEALAKVSLVPDRFEGRDGHRVEGAAFTLQSSAGTALTKDVAVALDEVFAAYRRFFQPRRDPGRKVRVLLFADRTEYDLYSIARSGAAMAPVAYYRIPDHTIVAYNLVERDREREIRRELTEAQKELERRRQGLQDLERRVTELVATARRKVQEEAAELRKAARPEQRAEIDREERRILDELKEGRGEAQALLREERRKALEAVEACQRVIDRNENVVAGQNGLLFETMFHEGFHAFAAAHLWQGSGEREFPRWLHEGMACYFERAAVENGALVHGGTHPALLQVVKQRTQARSELPLDKLLRGGAAEFSLSHPSEADRRTAFYAQSWALAHYLSTRVSPAQVEAYVEDVLKGTDAAAAFERLAGKPLRQVEAELKAHVESLK